MIMKKHGKAFLIAGVVWVAVILSTSGIYGQQKDRDMVEGIPVNYNESLVGTYTLPDPLVFADGEKVKNARQWYKKRRPQILALFEEYQYGRVPAKPKDMTFNVFDSGTPALNGTAIRKQVTIYFTKDTSDHKMDLLIYLPAGATKPVPLFFNIGFVPNAAAIDDPGIKAGLVLGKDGKRIPVQRKGGFGRMDISPFPFGGDRICYCQLRGH